MKKKNAYLLALLLVITGCNSNEMKKVSTTVQEPAEVNSTKVLTVNLDEELKNNLNKETLRGSKNNIIEGSIFMHDNDEVSFKGDILDEYSPVTVKIGDNDEVSFTGKEYKVKSMELKHGDIIEMKDKDGKVFLEMEIIE